MASPLDEVREALEAVLTEAGMQAHKHGCPQRLKRPAKWDESKPCAGCKAESALARLSEVEGEQARAIPCPDSIPGSEQMATLQQWRASLSDQAAKLMSTARLTGNYFSDELLLTQKRLGALHSALAFLEGFAREPAQPAATSRPAEWDQDRPCRSCGKPVEVSRRCYAHPVCYACLPPPPPLPAATSEGAWRPIATAPREEVAIFWVVEKDPKDLPTDTSGNRIFGGGPPRIHIGKHGTWCSLSKATHWMPLPAAPAPPAATSRPHPCVACGEEALPGKRCCSRHAYLELPPAPAPSEEPR